jgi:cyclopropane fatty-acyl-phospholipid synthase-like methyltransferase
MKTLEESIATAMDSQDTAIVPYLPYILQDFWEIGTSPEIVIHLIQRHCTIETRYATSLQVLDLGCGKGAVSIKLAATLQCNCYGVDGIPEFIEASKNKAQECNVASLCRFEVGDIRKKIEELDKFDVIILGAIGQVFGNYCTTLTTLLKHLTAEGVIIIEDSYIEDSDTFQHPAILHRWEILEQTEQAGMELVDEFIGEFSEFIDSAKELENIEKRCKELMLKYPGKRSLFENYIQNQAIEYEVLENRVIGSTMVFKKIT